MVRHRNITHLHAGAFVVALCLSGTLAEAQFTSGSSGAHGPFPPLQGGGGTAHNTAAFIVWNVTTGGVRYCSSYTLASGSDQCSAGSSTNVFVQIPNIPAGGLKTGIYEFTEVNIVTTGSTRRVVTIGGSSNAPLTILSQNNIEVGQSVLFHLNGQTAVNATTNFAEAGAKGGPGGFDGASSGNGGATPGHGSAGFGPSGGGGGQSDAVTSEGLNGAAAGAAPLNVSLTPLTGGSGGGGGAGIGSANAAGCNSAVLGFGGGPGGGGGGALLLAATNQINLASGSTILAHGGNGGRSSSSSTCPLFGGGGGGGSVRLVARELLGSGAINVTAGTRQNGASPAVGGHVRVEASLNSYSGTITGASGGSFLSFPTAAVPSNQPLLRITSIADTPAPTSPSASLVNPDISFSTPIEAPVTLTVAASNVPLGTVVNIKVVPATGQPTTATTSGLDGLTAASSTASATVTLPPGAGVVTASATFSIAGGGGGGGGGGAAFNALPLIDGKPFERVEVAALADGTSRTFLIAQNGVRFELATARR